MSRLQEKRIENAIRQVFTETLAGIGLSTINTTAVCHYVTSGTTKDRRDMAMASALNVATAINRHAVDNFEEFQKELADAIFEAANRPAR